MNHFAKNGAETTWTMGGFTYAVNVVEYRGEWAVIDLMDVASTGSAFERVGERVTVPVATVDVTRTTS